MTSRGANQRRPEAAVDLGLRLRLLGGFALEREGQAVRPETTKTAALLSWLVLNPGPHTRLKLMGLFWGGLPEARAARNLRRALWHLRRLLTTPAGTCTLVTNRLTAELVRKPDVWIDTDEITRLCTAAGGESGRQVELDALTAAVDLHRGELLDGMYVDDAPEIEDWLIRERDRFRDVVAGALTRLAVIHVAAGSYEVGVLCARKLLALDPWNEGAHRTLIELLALSGQRGAALSHYETCRRVLAEGLRTSPSAETTALYERLRIVHGDEPVGGVDPAPTEGRPGRTRGNIPSPPTQFIGRNRELREIQELLRSASCRLLTLVGLGGVGKTRLALQAAEQLQSESGDIIPDGAHFVPLEGIGSTDQLIPAIAGALRFPFSALGSPLDQLLDYLHEKRLLLVLDNFEHLPEGAGVLSEIISHSPQIMVIATSTERLRIAGEWALEVEGLDLPESPHGERADEAGSVRLFLQAARRARLGFTLPEGELPNVARICRLLDGMPLGIELAAAWVRALPVSAIADEVEADLDFLQSTLKDLPPRQRGLRTVFERTWTQTTPVEREAFTALSVFRGGFRLEAARAVSGVSSVSLASLVDRSLLHHDSAGRYNLHALLREYAGKELRRRPARHNAVRDRHAGYFSSFLRDREEALLGNGQVKALAEIEEDFDNIRIAWERAGELRDARLISEALDSLVSFYEVRARFGEGAKCMERTLNELRPAPPAASRANDLLIGRLLAARGGFLCRLGAYGEAQDALQEALDLLAGHEADRARALALIHLGDLLCAQGRYPEATRQLRESMDASARSGYERGFALALNSIGQVTLDLGRYAEASRLFRESLAIRRKLGDRIGAAAALNSMGSIAHDTGDYDAARHLYEESLEIRRDTGDTRGIAISLNNLGLIAHRRGDYAEATGRYRESLSIKRQIGYKWGVALTLDNLANLSVDMGDYAAAGEHFREATEIALSIDADPMLLEIIVGWGALTAKRGEVQLAERLLSVAIEHQASEKWTRERAQRLLAELPQDPRGSRSIAVEPVPSSPSPLHALACEILAMPVVRGAGS